MVNSWFWLLMWGGRDAGPVFPSVVELGLRTGQDVLAGLNQVCGERKLLAVENEEIALLVIRLLARPASILSVTNSVFLLIKEGFEIVCLI